uniref:Uncharacterized protein n=1 Tax=Romanomermis culicivorax TaxID=13658 RepID=A0A915KZC0_ROMCU
LGSGLIDGVNSTSGLVGQIRLAGYNCLKRREKAGVIHFGIAQLRVRSPGNLLDWESFIWELLNWELVHLGIAQLRIDRFELVKGLLKKLLMWSHSISSDLS